jgi:Lipocalin-like domain
MSVGRDGRIEHPLVGAWRLRDWVAVDDDGSTTRPMGEDPNGLLIYSADGSMLTVLGRGDRPRFAGDDIAGGTDEERSLAFSTCVAYGGRFSIAGEHVVHRVETSLFPNWIGTEQRRQWSLGDDGRDLVLTSPPLVFAGRSRIQRLSWVRQRD